MENITDADYKHEKRTWEGSRMQNHWEYHDLYVQSGTLPLRVAQQPAFFTRKVEIDKCEKLMSYLYNKANYVLHYKSSEVDIAL